MKSPHRYVTLLATASLAMAGAVYAQSSSGSGAGGASSGSGTGTGSSTGTGSGSYDRSDSTTGSGSRTTGSGTTGAGSASGAGSTSATGATGSGSIGAASSNALGSTMSGIGAGAMARVSKDDVKNRLTAKDLLGSAVYDSAGERIGDISDIDLQGAVPGSLMMSFSQSKNESGDASGAMTRSGQSGAGSTSATGQSASGTGTYAQNSPSSSPSATTNRSTSGTGMAGSSGTGTAASSAAGTTGSGMTGAGSAGTSGGSYAQSGTSGASTSGSTTSGARSTTGSSASDPLRDSSRALSNFGSSSAHATVFVSVGGLWGIGDDLVSVPASMLSYNTSDERFELAASKAEVVALAEGDRQSGYAGTSGAGTSSTAAGKQAFGDEVSRVQSALRSDPQTSSFAQNVKITSDGDTLQISGTVDSEQQKRQILDAARRATSSNIEDELEVRD